MASSLLSVSLSRVLSPPSDPASMLRPDDDDDDDECQGGGGAAGGRPMSPVEVAGELNRLFPFDEATELYFTMIYGVLDVASGAFRYVSAGHPGVVHLAAAGGGRIIDNRGYPIGLMLAPYDEHVLAMAPGDRIYLYSDGIPEAMNAAGKVFGGDRLLGALERTRGEPLDLGVASLLEEIRDWTGSAGLHDDVSLVAAEFLGPQA